MFAWTIVTSLVAAPVSADAVAASAGTAVRGPARVVTAAARAAVTEVRRQRRGVRCRGACAGDMGAPRAGEGAGRGLESQESHHPLTSHAIGSRELQGCSSRAATTGPAGRFRGALSRSAGGAPDPG